MLFKMFLTIHIISASISLVAGALAAIAVKGSKIHKRSGRFFVPGMLVATLSAVVLSWLHPNTILMGIGIFSLYLTLSGWIWVQRNKQKAKIKYARLLGSLALMTGLFLVGVGVVNFPTVNNVALVFGMLQLFFGVVDFRNRSDSSKNISRHAARMGGAYIATLTAFLVVNVDFVPFYIVWFLPSVIGTILLIWRIRKWNEAYSK